MPIFKDIRLLWFSALTFSKDGCPFQAEWQLCKRNAGKRRGGGIKSLLACHWKWDTAGLTVIHLSGIKTAEWHFQPRRRRGRITLSRCVCSRATRGGASGSLPEDPESQTHLKEAGDDWTHVPYSQILPQFCLPTTSEQLTPEIKISTVDKEWKLLNYDIWIQIKRWGMKERDMNVAAQTEWLETFKKNCGFLWNSVWITCEWWVPSHINFKCGINVWLRQKHWSALKFSFCATRNDDGRTKFYWTRRQMHKHHHQKFTAALPTASTGQTSRKVRGRNNGC